MKRCGNFENNGSKKIKFDENLEDLWGEDPDIDDIDDCLLLASQAHRNEGNFNTKMNNVSILPSYSFFKDDNKISYASTQVNNTFDNPSTSTFKVPIPQNNILNNNHENKERLNDLENKFNKLQSKFDAKEGEVTILRSQLRTTKDNLNSELIKKKAEWTEELNTSNKQKTKFATELEFKKLEIANLKRKLLDATKNVFETTSNCTQISKINKTDNENKLVKVLEHDLRPIFNEVFPLKMAISANIFSTNNVKKCSSFNSNHLFRNIAPYLQKEMTGRLLNLRPRVTMLNGHQVLKINYIFPEIFKLINCNFEDLNKTANNVHINKIISVSSQFLYNFHEYLKNIGDCTQKENIRQLDVEYLNIKNKSNDVEKCIFDPSLWSPDEEEIQCRQSIAVISEILPYNEYLKQYLTRNKCLRFSAEEAYILSLDPRINREENCYDFLKLILDVVKIIGQYRKTNIYVGFLCATCSLLSKVFESIDINNNNSDLFDLVTKILKEIVFARPIDLMFYYLSELLKNASLHRKFVQSLCNMDVKTNLKKNLTKGILLINEDCCIFQIFSLLIRDNLDNVESSYKKYEKHENILKFVSNAFNSNATWLAYQENVHFDCLLEINKLTIEIIYQAVDIYVNYRDKLEANHKTIVGKSSVIPYTIRLIEKIKRDNHETIVGCKTILRLSIKMLNILNFKSYAFIERDIAVHSKYQYIKTALVEMKDDLIDFREYDGEALEKILNNNQEESPVVNFDKLSEFQLRIDSV